MSEEELGGLQKRAVYRADFRIPYEYRCSICGKVSKRNSGHAHLSNLSAKELELKERRKILARQKLEREALLK